MGARLYIPGIGRFLQVDPVEGGGDNSYSYPTDPVDEFDLTGEWWGQGVATQYAKDLIRYNPATGIYGLGYNAYRGYQSPKRAALDVARVAVTYVPVGGGSRIAPVLSQEIKASGGLTNFFKNGNNIIRVGKGRLSVGPAPAHYLGGRLGSKMPFHIHMEKAKAGINLLKSGKSIRLWGNWR